MTHRGRVDGAGPRVRLPAHDLGGADGVTGPPTGPVRTCVGCRGRDQRTVLLRVVRDVGAEGDLAVVDPGRSLPGRGAWLHPDLQCLELAERRRAIPRALRVGSIDTTAVRRHLETPARPTVGLTGTTDHREGSGLEADGPPMSTDR